VAWLQRRKALKRKVVLATGAFDLLHYGHLNFLQEAKNMGGRDARLIVIVARDSTVEARKGKKPIVPEDQRRALIEALKAVDDAILGFEDMNYEAVIDRLNPDIIAVGYDQSDIKSSVEELIQRKGLKIRVFQTRKFAVDDIDSSSKIKRRVIEVEKDSS
jgi:FAD synthetase